MQIRIYQVGKTKDALIEQRVSEYLQRLSSFAKIEIININPSKKTIIAHASKEEGQALLEKIDPNFENYFLTEQGQELDSKQFSQLVANNRNQQGKLAFFIGGAFGFQPEQQALFPKKLSLSRLTFTHEMVRLILAEQLFRASTIIQNKNYHY